MMRFIDVIKSINFLERCARELSNNCAITLNQLNKNKGIEEPFASSLDSSSGDVANDDPRNPLSSQYSKFKEDEREDA